MAVKLQQRFGGIGSRLLLAVLLASSLVLMTLYVREGDQGAIHDVQSAFSGLMAPLKFVGGSVGSGTDAASNALANSTAQDSTLEALKSQNEQLRDQISQLEEYRQEAQRLEGLLNIQGYYSLETVAARVTDRSTNSWEMTVTIDKGSNDGIIAGLPVMASTGVVGQVISTTATSAQVRLLADPQSGVAVLIQSNRAQGIVSGSLEGLLYLEDIDADVDVQVGDVIVTSGLGGSYFRGLTVGTVVKVDENQGGSTRKIVVAPNASTGPMEEVLVVLKMNSEGDAALPASATDQQGTDGQDANSGDGNAG